jgi:hypothetical protein
MDLTEILYGLESKASGYGTRCDFVNMVMNLKIL